jgi:hypothetical protein
MASLVYQIICVKYISTRVFSLTWRKRPDVSLQIRGLISDPCVIMKKNQILISIRIKHVSAARVYHYHQPLSFHGSCQAQKKFTISSAHPKYQKKSWMKYNGGNSFRSSPSSTLLPHFPPLLHPQPPHLSPSPTNQTKTSENGVKDGSRLTAPSRDFWFDTSMYAMAWSGPHGRRRP